jgi:hypothetical protein
MMKEIRTNKNIKKAQNEKSYKKNLTKKILENLL